MAEVQTAIDPRFMAFSAWATAMRVQNSDLPRAGGEDQWRGWATQALQYEPNWPDPRRFEDWRGWALATLQTV